MKLLLFFSNSNNNNNNIYIALWQKQKELKGI
jgi:hypothetical protein